MGPALWKKEAYKKGTVPLADAVNVARHALKRGQQAEHNVENSLLLPRKVLHTNGFRLSVHFYIILPATLVVIKRIVLAIDELFPL
jgi:hypothetical protein